MRAASLSAFALAALMMIPAASQAAEPLRELPHEDLLDLVEGLRFEDVTIQNETEDGISIRVETGNFFFFVENYNNGYVRIVAWFDNADGVRRSTLSFVNEWNLHHGFTKAYLNADGQYVLEADFELDHDTTEAGIEERVLQFVEHLNAFGNQLDL